jgi:SAM-dependent methyltransferase
MTTGLPHSPAADRNKDAILGVLQRQAAVLEIAAGTGQHAAHAAAAQPRWIWQPTDADADALPHIALRCARLANVRPPLQLDVLAWPWPLGGDMRFDAVFSANMLHISPWETCAALMRGAAAHLRQGGRLLVYGPFIAEDTPTAASNQAFDADLRARNPAWGLRRLADVMTTAAGAALDFEQRIAMPANNLVLVFVKR